MTLLATLRELAALPGPSGNEREVALAFAKHLHAFADEVSLDPFGNVIATIRGDNAQAAVMLSAHVFDLHVVGAVQEEVGSRGARVAAQTLRPHVAISVDTVAGAEPGTPRARATQVSGEGPVIRAWEWMSGSMSGTGYHRGLFERLQDIAAAAAIPHQLDIARTWTDACGIAAVGHGIPTAGIYIPRRCAHSPCEIAKLSDLENAARLLGALFASLDGRDLRELGSPTRL